nr:MAG TPA: hypothetical protein [Bacteriophage sp.]
MHEIALLCTNVKEHHKIYLVYLTLFVKLLTFFHKLTVNC